MHCGGKTGKTALGRTKRKLEKNIKMDIQGTGWVLHCIGVAQDRD